MKKYLAIDIGASSGRHIVGWTENGKLCTEEVYRFPNGVKEVAGRLTWDIGALFSHVKAGIRAAFAKRNAHPFFVSGFLLLIMSLFVIYPVYYLVTGSVLMIAAIVVRATGFA